VTRPDPRPRPEPRLADDPTALLERLLVLFGRRPDRRDELVRTFLALHDGLSSGEMHVPQQWTAAQPAPVVLPADADAELAAARAAVEAAQLELANADHTALTAQADRDARARAVGEARKKFYDLARVRDLSRP
jgi:hypothetical protein